jgi:hypothetical protein
VLRCSVASAHRRPLVRAQLERINPAAFNSTPQPQRQTSEGEFISRILFHFSTQHVMCRSRQRWKGTRQGRYQARQPLRRLAHPYLMSLPPVPLPDPNAAGLSFFFCLPVQRKSRRTIFFALSRLAGEPAGGATRGKKGRGRACCRMRGVRHTRRSSRRGWVGCSSALRQIRQLQTSGVAGITRRLGVLTVFVRLLRPSAPLSPGHSSFLSSLSLCRPSCLLRRACLLCAS